MSLERTALSEAVARHGAVARVVIAAHAGSAPRETGAAMLVWADTDQNGGQSGTIGGGALEFEAARRARALLSGPSFARQILTQPLGPALGQCCGGAVTLLIERYTAEELVRIPETGVFARPVTAGPPPEDGQPPLSTRRARQAARIGQSEALLADGWFSEDLSATLTPLWIYGAGHVGRALVATLEGLPFAITWVDDARDRFPDEIPDRVTRLVASNPADAPRHAPADARHLVLTYSHRIDLDLCDAILRRDFISLGLIGSATKKARFLRRLADLGHRPETLARLDCPIGDRGLGKHPQAIAVGVVHRLLKDRATRAADARPTSGAVA